jgi:hypothetical protein
MMCAQCTVVCQRIVYFNDDTLTLYILGMESICNFHCWAIAGWI